jgi:hypothetical protein
VLAATEDLAQPIISAYQRHGLIEQAQVNLNEPTRLSFDERAPSICWPTWNRSG